MATQSSRTSKRNAASKKGGATTENKVVFNLTEPMQREVERIQGLTQLSRPDIFRSAFSLLRIHIDAATKGQKVAIIDPQRPEQQTLITLPFSVAAEEMTPNES